MIEVIEDWLQLKLIQTGNMGSVVDFSNAAVHFDNTEVEFVKESAVFDENSAMDLFLIHGEATEDLSKQILWKCFDEEHHDINALLRFGTREDIVCVRVVVALYSPSDRVGWAHAASSKVTAVALEVPQTWVVGIVIEGVVEAFVHSGVLWILSHHIRDRFHFHRGEIVSIIHVRSV